jgi:hypothetical protein
MTSVAGFLSRSAENLAQLELDSDCVLFHGDPIDTRGELAVSFDKLDIERIRTVYDVEKMTLYLNDHEIGADQCAEFFSKYSKLSTVILEATTLGFAELFSAIRALISCGCQRLEIIYVEPANYSRETASAEQFALSDLITGYHPIPHSVVDLTADDLEAGVFFLGFESERLDRAVNEYQMIVSKEIKVVFGIPAFQPGWELNSIVPHIPLLSERRFDIAYCAANDPEAAYECLESTRSSLSHGKRMFVAPIGTKPCGIASAVFASLYPDQVGLLFDHPKKRSKRSKGSSVWHRYSVIISDS